MLFVSSSLQEFANNYNNEWTRRGGGTPPTNDQEPIFCTGIKYRHTGVSYYSNEIRDEHAFLVWDSDEVDATSIAKYYKILQNFLTL